MRTSLFQAMLLAGGVLWAASGAKACPIDQAILEAREAEEEHPFFSSEEAVAGA